MAESLTHDVLILGAAGRDFHDFNVVHRDDPSVEVVAFTAAQIPGISHRRYPPSLAGPLYPQGIPIEVEAELDTHPALALRGWLDTGKRIDGGLSVPEFAGKKLDREAVVAMKCRLFMVMVLKC